MLQSTLFVKFTATKSETAPAPTSITFNLLSEGKISLIKLTATEPIEIAPLPIPVSVLTLFPTTIAI